MCLDCGFQGLGRAVGPALDLWFAEGAKKRSSRLVQDADLGVKCGCQPWPVSGPVADRLGLVARRVVHANVDVSGHILLEAAELVCPVP